MKQIFKDKRGILGLETVRVVIVTLLVLAVTSIAVFLALVSLQDAGIFTADSQAANDTDKIIGNITSGTTDFFANVPTFMILLGVVVLLLIIAIVLVVVGRFGGTTGGADL
jgi:hypothetical protein